MEHFRFSKNRVKGFTLIEIMVALFIMSVSTGLLFSNYPDSTIRLTLLNASHDLALLFREAQIKGSSIENSNTTISGFGIYINSATSSRAILFADSPNNINNDIRTNSAGFAIGDGLYNPAYSPEDTISSALTLKDGYSFKKLCVASSTATENYPTPHPFLCNSVNNDSIKSLTISFIRPSQAAHIYVNNNSLNDFAEACVELYSPKSPKEGHIRSVHILRPGVISTLAKTCD